MPERARTLPAALALFLACLAAILARYRAPDPLPLEAPAGDFSAARAMGPLARLLGSGKPHPVGSADHERLRETLVADLIALGWKTEVQEAFACGPYGTCATVRNVLATRPEMPPTGDVVAYLCHYDSVPAGPGASDDALAVAAGLEIARALAAAPPARHPIALIVTDGEELGLLGASALLDHPLGKRIQAVVNLEARGTRGPSLLFETGDGSAALLRAAGPALRRPITNSVMGAVYRRLPNDTDLTVIKRAGKTGVNFGFVGGVAHYHTPLDDLRHVSAATLQHHGENALAALRALASAELPPAAGEAVYFDVAALAVVRWPARASAWIAVAALLLLLVVIGRVRLRPAAWGALGALGCVVLSALLIIGTVAALRGGALAANWPARPLPLIVLTWLLGFLPALAAARFLARRAGPGGLFAGTLALQLALGAAAALLEPGLSYPFLVPAVVAGLPAALGFFRGAVLAHVAATVLVTLPTAVLLYDGMGAGGLAVVAFLVALAALTLAPAAAEDGRSRFVRSLLPAAALAAAPALVVTALSPAFSPESPRRLNLALHHDADSGKARWLSRAGSAPLPPALRVAGAFAPQPVRPFPWSSNNLKAFEGPAPPLESGGLAVEALESSAAPGGRQVRLRLVSPRAAPVVRLLVPPGAPRLEVFLQGVKVPTDSASKSPRYSRGWWAVECRTVPPGGLLVELRISGSERLALVAVEETRGLPPSGQALLSARPADVVPSDEGDVTVVTKRLEL